MKKKILFICTHNSARSQLAEGLANHYWKERCQAFSAGTQPSTVNPFAIKALAELGIDISGARSQNTAEFAGQEFDLAVTVCDSARENCPYFPGAKNYIHKSFKDPSQVEGTDEEKLTAFREARDEILNWLKGLLDKE
jgi:arsenate reductase